MSLTLPIKPQLAELVEAPHETEEGWTFPKFFDDPGWAFEFKWDGHRLIIERHAGGVRLYARSGRVVSTEYPEITQAAYTLPIGTILDGEVVALVGGKSNLQALAGRATQTPAWRTANLRYFAFDILQSAGGTLERLAYSRRRESLDALFDGYMMKTQDTLGISAYVTDPLLMWDLVTQYKLEGMIAKPLEAPYMQDARGPWRKIKLNQRGTFSVVGFTLGQGSRQGSFGAMLLAEPDGAGGLRYAGKCGTGFSTSQASSLMEAMRSLGSAGKATLDNLQAVKASIASPGDLIHWIYPGLEIEIEFAERSDNEIVRFPSFRGVTMSPGKSQTDKVSILTRRAPAITNAAQFNAAFPPIPRPTGVAVSAPAPSSGSVLTPVSGMAFQSPGSSGMRNVVVQGKGSGGLYLACDCPAGRFVWKGGSYKPCKHIKYTLEHELAGNTIVDGIFQ